MFQGEGGGARGRPDLRLIDVGDRDRAVLLGRETDGEGHLTRVSARELLMCEHKSTSPRAAKPTSPRGEERASGWRGAPRRRTAPTDTPA